MVRAAAAAAGGGGMDASLKLNALVDELQVEVDSRCTQLEATTEQLASMMQSHFKMLLEKLPKKVRNMKVEDFCREHGGEADSVTIAQLQELFARYPPLETVEEDDNVPMMGRVALSAVKPLNMPASAVKRTVRKRTTTETVAESNPTSPAKRMTRSRNSTVLSTPSVSGPKAVAQTPCVSSNSSSSSNFAFVAQTPAPRNNTTNTNMVPATPLGTVMRLPRRGEAITSVRGSPQGVYESDAAASFVVDKDNKIGVLAISLDETENAVNIADPSVHAGLSKDVKAKAAAQLTTMKKQMDALIKQLRA